MIFIHGSGLYGKCDHLPKLFYVATRFGHIWYMPLIPWQSYLVIDGTESRKDFSGCPIGLSAKSILLAYFRMISFLGAVCSMISLAVILNTVQGAIDWTQAGLLIVVSIVLFALFWASYRLGQPSPARALMLGKAAGIDPEMIERYFDGSPEERDVLGSGTEHPPGDGKA